MAPSSGTVSVLIACAALAACMLLVAPSVDCGCDRYAASTSCKCKVYPLQRRGCCQPANVFDPFSLVIWVPFQGFSNAVADSNLGRETSAFSNAQIRQTETPENLVFTADLPGLTKEQVKVELEGRVLKISRKSGGHEEKNDKWHQVDRRLLPQNAKENEVKAAMENGVLTVTVRKEEVKRIVIDSK